VATKVGLRQISMTLKLLEHPGPGSNFNIALVPFAVSIGHSAIFRILGGKKGEILQFINQTIMEFQLGHVMSFSR